MGINFRKSFRVGKNTRINISKGGGIGFSTGFKGFRISKNRHGLRLTIGKDGVYYTKIFAKEKRMKKLNIKSKVSTEVEKKVIDPDTDFERIPTNDEELLYLYLGSKVRNYPMYLLLITLIGLIVYSIIVKSFLSYVLICLWIMLLLYYRFFTKISFYIYGLNRSIKFFLNDKYDKAYKILEKCLIIKPESEKGLILIIFSAFKLEKYSDVIKYISEYKKIAKPIEVLYFIEGFAYTLLGEYKEGIDAIEEVYSKEDDIRYAKYKILGDCYLGLNNIDMAINWYEELPVNDENMNDVLLEYKYALGKALYLKGNKKRAFNYLAKVYDYCDDYKDVKQLLNNM